jgi:hypothetical protein
MSALRTLPIAFVLAAAFALPMACSGQNEGDPCGVVTSGTVSDFSQYNAQCSSSYACVARNIGGKLRGVCCPTSGAAVEAICGTQTTVLLEAGPFADASGVDASTDAGADTGTDSGTRDAATAADTGNDAAADGAAQ